MGFPHGPSFRIVTSSRPSDTNKQFERQFGSFEYLAMADTGTKDWDV